MRKTSLRCLCILIFLIMSGASYSQEPGRNDPPNGEAELEADKQEKSDTSSPSIIVELHDNVLSVDLDDAEFGNVLNSIAEKSGFQVEILNDISQRKITTKFTDLELEKGILRLFTLVRERNYLIQYDTKGMVSRIEVYGETAPPVAASQQRTPARSQVQRPATQPSSSNSSPVVRRRRTTPVPTSRRARTSRRSIQTRSRTQRVTEEMDDQGNGNEKEEPVREIPYVPSDKKPVYIPPSEQ